MITQVNPWVLEGLESELPDPDSVPNNATIYFATDTNVAFILVIDPVTQIHTWRPLAGPLLGGFTLPFSAAIPIEGSGLQTKYIADDADQTFDNNSQNGPYGFPAPATFTKARLLVNVKYNPFDTSTVTFTVFKDGVATPCP